LGVGDAHDAVARGLEDDVALPVGLERAAVVVVGVAVELGDEVVLGPVQVDFVAVDDRIGDRLG